jgi:type IX secretion system PorP/SprF family membrane protein
MYKYLLNIIIVIGFCLGSAGQDVYFSQFFNSILYLNPAYAGAAHQTRISAAYRNQMPALGSPYVTYNASYDQPVKALQGGIGINLQNDMMGPALNRVSADAIYSYFLAVNNRLTLHAGFQVSYVHRFLRSTELILPDQVGAVSGTPSMENIGDMSKGYPDFAIGFAAFTRTIYGGAAMYHLARPNLSFSRSEAQQLPRRLTVHGGIYIPLYEKKLGREALKLNPNLVYMHQAGFRQLNYGIDLIYKTLTAGVWLRHSLDFRVNAFVMHFGYEQDQFRIGYSHDFNMAGTWSNMQHLGAHELTFLLKLTYQRGPRDRFRTIKSPKI